MLSESGIDFIRHVTAEYPDTAVIMVTGVDDPEIAETALEIGAYGYIIKPFRNNELIINIQNSLRRQELEITSRCYREDLERTVAERTAKLRKVLEGIDGSGYPQGLSGEEILLQAKILGVADVVEAMASHRPYRPALGIEKALEEISQNKGLLYDPDVVYACLKFFKEKRFEF